ncbi:MAG: hypothetical protein N2746_09880 [Deltaproteobacteria bacterium]|nr:hypothetical protein [Deltaproteobacteria bacterium]
MNIGILGGGGIRSPIIIRMLSDFNFGEALEEVRVYDIDARKTDAILKLASAIISKSGKKIDLIKCSSIEEFSDNLDAVVFTIREGFEEGRAIDERICLRYNIIGQETTGAAGFSFAARSIPSLISYSEEIRKRSPNCILINFTNPAGIVVRALNIAGFEDVIGICDSADACRIYASEFLKRDRFSFESEIVGLNHLSWTTRLLSDSRDILPELIMSEEFYNIAHGPFERSIFVKDGLFKNEYLYYYYCSQDALKGMMSEAETRGEYLLRVNRELVENLLKEENPERLIQIYEKYLNNRFETYMSYAYHNIKRRVVENESEGYAEVALRIISAIREKKDLNIPMILPNKGTLNFLPDEYVVEKFCYIRGGSINSKQIEFELPESVIETVKRVAEYENVAAQAILNKSLTLAEKALSVHPLIGERVAGKILKEFLCVHSKYFSGYK